MKTLLLTLLGYFFIMAVFVAGLYLSGCSAYGQRQVSPCFYSEKCLSDVIVRELDTQKEYQR